jgi:hypothetical protein
MTAGEYVASPYRYAEGWVDYIDVTQPAAGANAAIVVPGEYGLRVLAARATLTTDANAANRLVSLDFITANAVTRVRNLAAAVVVANTTNQRYEWNSAWAVSEHAANAATILPVFGLLLPPTWLVQFTVDNKQVGDQLAGLSLVVEKVPTGAAAESY